MHAQMMHNIISFHKTCFRDNYLCTHRVYQHEHLLMQTARIDLAIIIEKSHVHHISLHYIHLHKKIAGFAVGLQNGNLYIKLDLNSQLRS